MGEIQAAAGRWLDIHHGEVVSSEGFEYGLSEGEQLTIPTAVGQIIGAASMCWSETPTGVFDSERAQMLSEQLLRTIDELACRGDGSTVPAHLGSPPQGGDHG